MKKTYCLDTNILLADPSALNAFEDNDIVIPLIVLEELDNHKSRQDEVGRNARQISRTLDDLRKIGSLAVGVKLPNGGTLRIVTIDQSTLSELPAELRTTKVDNALIAFMLKVKITNERSNSEQFPIPILVTKDVNVRIKCDALGINCQDYLKMRVADDQEKLYRGVDVIEIPAHLVDKFYSTGELALNEDEAMLERCKSWFSNQIIIIKHSFDGQTTRSAITRFTSLDKPLLSIDKIDSAFGLKPRNKEQTFAFDLLFDDSIKLVTLTGPAGTGKTCVVLAAALEQLNGLGRDHKTRYEKLLITRPVLPIGKDIGFLPGTLEEKMEPWIAPIRDNLNFLINSNKSSRIRQGNDDYITMLQERGLIEVEAISFIRGRSIPNTFMIIDESQNLSVHELKTILTRVGEGTKIVLTGDIEQIDNVHVDMYTNGLTYAIEKFKHHNIAGHITLLKGERSALATLASQIL